MHNKLEKIKIAIFISGRGSNMESLIKASKKMEIVHVTNLKEKIYATPAVVDSKIYIRSADHLWSFGE